MLENINVAVIGLGRLGYWHAQNVASKVNGATLKYVVDPLPGKAEKVANELKVENWSENIEEVLQSETIDAVVIVTPTNTHADLIMKAADYGKHIFVEKPLTQYVHEAETVIKHLNDKKVSCQVGFMRRFDPAYTEAKQRISAGDIGKPLFFKGTSRDGNIPPMDFIKNSGGIFLDLAIHEYDIARYLMDSEISDVRATGSVLRYEYMRELNDLDYATTFLNFNSGASGDIETSWISPYGYDIRGEVVGSEGAIQIGSMQQHQIQLLNARGNTYDIIPDFPTKFENAYLLEMEHFIESLRKQEPPRCNAVDGKIALEVSTLATESYQRGETVKIPEAQQV